MAIVKKKKEVEEVILPVEETPIVEEVTVSTPTLIDNVEGHAIATIQLLDSGNYAITTKDGLGYTLPRSEVER